MIQYPFRGAFSMHNPRLHLVVVALVISVWSAPMAAQAAPTDSAAVAAVLARYDAALASGDSAAALALLAPDAVILESGGMETRE